MEGSETGGAWMGTGAGREQDGRRMVGAGEGVGEGRWRGAKRDGRCMGREDGGERDGRCMGTGLGREDGGERDGRRMDGDGAGEGAKRNEAWRGPMLLHASRLQNVVVRVERSCAVDLLVTRTWVHHKHQCRLLRVSSQVERSMGGGSSARSDARRAVLQGLYDGTTHAPDSPVMAETAGLLRARTATLEI